MYWWNSSSAGAFFTGVTSWKADINASGEFVITEDWTKPVLKVHLTQVAGVKITPGVNWASCEFEYLNDGRLASYKTDGIPNEDALRMQAELHEEIVEKLADVIDEKAVALDAWLSLVSMRVRNDPDVIVTDEAIQDAVNSEPPPASPGNASWTSLLWHPLAQQARDRQKKWPNWNSPPEDVLAAQAHEHNLNAFARALKTWDEKTAQAMPLGRWIPKGMLAGLLANFPPPRWPGKSWRETTGDATPEETLQRKVSERNEAHLLDKTRTAKPFFDTVETNPLTDEQIKACVCMDESVLVVAAAGSGKTSTIVAKTGYILSEGLAAPGEILLLAFNRAAANEVGERIAERLRSVPNVGEVRSDTFHAFGMDVIAKATGKKPSLAPWVSPDKPGADLREVSVIIETLSATDSEFKSDWDLFRSVYARDIGRWGEAAEPDAYAGGKRGFLTARGDIVKSKEERQIADWLFFHHVNYDYERPYEHDTATEFHRQYIPDFYYPEIQLYHEHFALNEYGEAPAHFKGYKESVIWKRKIHADKGTQLFETMSHGIYDGKCFEQIKSELTKRGITLQFDPDRVSPGQEAIPEKDLARSFRVFQQHVKNNGLNSAQLHASLQTQSKDGHGARLRLYLSLYERIAAEWERKLRQGGYIDFEDMLVQAAEHVESGRYRSPYTVILGDEFQDSSRVRIRLLSALGKNPGVPTHLLVVGDDWQGINRFAGSDVSVMTEFDKSFPNSTQINLSTTFRCPQELCDASSEFVLANPVQLRKTVLTTNTFQKTPMLAYGFQDQISIATHIEEQLADMHRFATAGKLKPGKGGRVTILLLGRYRSDEPANVGIWQKRFGDLLKIDFNTVHSSKGLEAEYVFVLNVIQDSHGFPSQIQDDPALQLAMPTPDPFPYAEERRLFYVAMTRARKQVRFYTLTNQPSQFLVELAKNKRLRIECVDGQAMAPCPKCGCGFLLLRKNARGEFYGCTRFPRCDYTKRSSFSNLAGPGAETSSSTRIDKPVKASDRCPVCQRGKLIRRDGKNGAFLGCTNFPRCRATANLSNP